LLLQASACFPAAPESSCVPARSSSSCHNYDLPLPLPRRCPALRVTQVESHLAHAPLTTRKLARALAVFLLSYATAFMETLTISHVRQQQQQRRQQQGHGLQFSTIAALNAQPAVQYRKQHFRTLLLCTRSIMLVFP
jgi:hypothetical protein